MPCREMDLRVEPQSFLHLTNHPARLAEGGCPDLARASPENLPCPAEVVEVEVEVEDEVVVGEVEVVVEEAVVEEDVILNSLSMMLLLRS